MAGTFDATTVRQRVGRVMKTEGLLGTRIVSAVHDRDVSRQPGDRAGGRLYGVTHTRESWQTVRGYRGV